MSFGTSRLASIPCLILLLGCAGAADRGPSRNQPNFLVILADDLGYSDIGCYGGEISTPNLDGLAAGGLRFTQFYNTARCWPTRSCLLSGYYAPQIRMDPPKGRLPGWARLLPQELRPAGYRSYHSGKWHVMGAPKPVADGGFDRSYDMTDQDRHFSPKSLREDDRPLPPVKPGSGYYSTSAIADHAVRCLEEHARLHSGEPFFSYLAFISPHFPLHALKEDIDLYRDKYLEGWDVIRERRWKRLKEAGLVSCALSARDPNFHPRYFKKEFLDRLGPGEVETSPAWAELNAVQRRFQATKMAIHAAMVHRMDIEIGRVLDQLRAMSAMENTVIVFLSDNGADSTILVRGDGHDPAADPGSAASYLCLGPGWASASNSPFRRHKIWVHERGISTPMIVHWPQGIRAR
jgi:arylsulfatase A-like enzyme